MMDYLRCSFLNQLGLTNDDFVGFVRLVLFKERIQIELSKAVFFGWISFQIIIHTIKNSGFKQNTIYCIDESYLTVRDEVVLQFVRTSKDLLCPDTISRFTLEYFKETLEASNRFHSIKPEDFELAAIFHIYAMQLAIRLFPENRNMKMHLNDLFKEACF